MAELFRLPEYESAWQEFMSDSIHELARAKDPILAQIPTVTQEVIPQAKYTSEGGGEPLLIDPMQVAMTFEFSVGDAIVGDFTGVYAALDTAADQYVEQIMPAVFDHIRQLSESTGNVVDAGGKPMSWDLILDMIEKVEIAFDKDGIASLPTIVANPRDWEKLGEPSPAHKQRLDEIIRKKREEALARRSSRKLPRQSG